MKKQLRRSLGLKIRSQISSWVWIAIMSSTLVRRIVTLKIWRLNWTILLDLSWGKSKSQTRDITIHNFLKSLKNLLLTLKRNSLRKSWPTTRKRDKRLTMRKKRWSRKLSNKVRLKALLLMVIIWEIYHFELVQLFRAMEFPKLSQFQSITINLAEFLKN